MTSPPDDTTTDLHAVIAALRAERDAGLAREATLAEELAARTAELAESRGDRARCLAKEIFILASRKTVIRRELESPINETGVFSTWKRRAPVSRHGSCHPVHRALSGFDRLSPRPQRPDRHRHGQHRADHRRAVR